MAAGQSKKILYADWCFAGVILFFIVRGYSEHQFLVPVSQLLLLLGVLLLIGVALYFIFRRIFQNGHKAALYTAFFLTILLFFGVFQDFLAQFKWLASFTKLTILLPLNIVALVVLFIWMKRTKRSFNRTVFFVNTLLLLYLVFDLAIIAYRFISPPQNEHLVEKYQLHGCDTCAKPPVYFILLDSYYGSTGLKAYFNYDNSAFEGSLKAKGFRVNSGSISNYYYTLYSMASMLNMEYLEGIGEPVLKNHYAFTRATGNMRNNIVCRYFYSLGYRVNNYSIFDMPGAHAGYNSGDLPDKIQLVTHKTMYYRVRKYLPQFLVRMKWVKHLAADIENEYIGNNETMIQRTLAESRSQNSRPAFTYTHLMMPHGPYVFDSLGNRTNIMDRQPLRRDLRDQMFLQYQVYTNKRISAFIDELQKATHGKAVIVLMSDHGYQAAFQKEKKLAFYNLNAVYLPQRSYAGWYDGVSNVNQFRILFNTLYQQDMPLLRDTIIAQ